MTYNEVKALGAEIVRDSLSRIPLDGWAEISIEDIQRIQEEVNRELQRLAQGRNADAYHEASMLKNSSAAALEKAQAGARVFSVAWDGMRAFMATKA
jgi:ribosomal 50S subunit-associated protein YjgA (DUF615 family)